MHHIIIEYFLRYIHVHVNKQIRWVVESANSRLKTWRLLEKNPAKHADPLRRRLCTDHMCIMQQIQTSAE